MSPKILLIDDDEDMSELVGHILSRPPAIMADVQTVGSVEAAQAALSEGPIDLIIADYRIGGDNGLEFLQQARFERPDAKTVLFTGYAGSWIRQHDPLAKAADIIVEKDRALSEISRSIRTLLDKTPEPA